MPLRRHPGSCSIVAVRTLVLCQLIARCKSAYRLQVPPLLTRHVALSLRPAYHQDLHLPPCLCLCRRHNQRFHRQPCRCPQHRRSWQGRLLGRHNRALRCRRHRLCTRFLRRRHGPLPLERQIQPHLHFSQLLHCHHHRVPRRPFRPPHLQAHHQRRLRRAIHPACLWESRRHRHHLPSFHSPHRLHRRRPDLSRHHQHRLIHHDCLHGHPLLLRSHHLRAAKLPPPPVPARQNLATTTLRAPIPHIPTTGVASGATRAEGASSAGSAALVHLSRAQPQARWLPPRILLRQWCSTF